MSSIGGIQSNASMSAMSYARPSGGLSAEQKNGIQSVLKNFDPKNLTSADAKSITSEFKKLGVQPGKDLETTMAASGFDAKEVGRLAFGSSMPPGGPQGGNPPPPPPAGGNVSSEEDVSDYLSTLIASLTSNTDSKSNDDLTKSEFNQILKTASDLLGSTGNLVDRAV
jgi:hypothetical protein